MGEPTKKDLLDEADALGVEGVDEDTTNPNIQAAIDAKRAEQHALEAAGPIVPIGQSEPDPPAPSGKPNTGIQPLTDDDLPDALR